MDALAGGAITLKNDMEKVIKLIENLDDLSLKLRQTVNRYYDLLMCVEPKNTAPRVEKEFTKKYLPTFKNNISVSVNDGIIKISMFPLIKNMSSKTKHYITQCINDALKEYKTHTHLAKFYEPAVVAICNERPQWDRIYDADNVEINAVINALAPHLLSDDGPKYLSVYRMGRAGKEAATLIYIMALSSFPEWVSRQTTVGNTL